MTCTSVRSLLGSTSSIDSKTDVRERARRALTLGEVFRSLEEGWTGCSSRHDRPELITPSSGVPGHDIPAWFALVHTPSSDGPFATCFGGSGALAPLDETQPHTNPAASS